MNAVAKNIERLVGVPLDGCLCTECQRHVTGTNGDLKMCAIDGGKNIVLCAACFLMDPRREKWLEWRIDRAPALQPP
jgi:hypothetical protein